MTTHSYKDSSGNAHLIGGVPNLTQNERDNLNSYMLPILAAGYPINSCPTGSESLCCQRDLVRVIFQKEFYLTDFIVRKLASKNGASLKLPPLDDFVGHVVSWRPNKEMRRIAAGRVVTHVTDMFASWIKTHVVSEHVGGAVSKPASSPCASISNSNLSVPVGRPVLGPLPTFVTSPNVNKRPELFDRGGFGAASNVQPGLGVPLAVVVNAPATCPHRSKTTFDRTLSNIVHNGPSDGSFKPGVVQATARHSLSPDSKAFTASEKGA